MVLLGNVLNVTLLHKKKLYEKIIFSFHFTIGGFDGSSPKKGKI
jgi:hypothetical protein